MITGSLYGMFTACGVSISPLAGIAWFTISGVLSMENTK
jgi:hypothetical protein